MCVIGVDPGATETGIVVRCGERLVRHLIATGTFAAIAQAIDDADAYADHVPVVAIEDVTAPNPHMGMTNVTALLETARLVGYLQGVYPEAVLVPPGRHGKSPLVAYPSELVGPRETAGTGRLRHCRSAWDIAAIGSLIARAS